MIDQAQAIRLGEELPIAALQAYLQSLWGTDFHLHTIRQFPGGFSNLTYLLETNRGDMVLRRPPFGAHIKSGHDMGREFQVLNLLRPVFPKVPNPIHHCEEAEESPLGAPFYLMERVRGLILRSGRPEAEGLSAEQWRSLSRTAVETMVDLHGMDLSGPLGELGKPEGYTRRQVAGWIGRYARAKTGELPAMTEMETWMQAHFPPEQAPAFLHNDYKYDNLVLDPGDPGRILALLDWEMATVGDPLMDLGASLAYWVEAGDPPATRLFNVTHHAGNMTRQEVVGHYAARSGRDVSGMLFYYVFGCYKLAVIVQQIYARYVAGHTRDTRFKHLDKVVEAVAGQGLWALERGRIGA
ncbi:MAG: phosphotransferase family protein [Bacteroidetes bacterium]|nr:MAG: phosphotransferase family protein [Bacteroidota bacterium]